MPSDWVRQFLDLSSIHEKHELTHVRKMFQATWSSSHGIFQRSFCGFTLSFCFQFATHTRRHHLQMKNIWKGSACNDKSGFKVEERTSTRITCKVAEHKHVNVPSRIKEGLKAPRPTSEDGKSFKPIVAMIEEPYMSEMLWNYIIDIAKYIWRE